MIVYNFIISSDILILHTYHMAIIERSSIMFVLLERGWLVKALVRHFVKQFLELSVGKKIGRSYGVNVIV
jgi:hypothetical protein